MKPLRLLSPPAIVAGGAAALAAVIGGPRLIGGVGLLGLVLAALVYPVLGVGSLLVMAPIYLLLTPYVPIGLPVAFLVLALTFVGLAVRRVIEPRMRPFRWTSVDVAAAILLLNGLIYIPLAANLKTGVYGYHELFRLFLLYFVVRLLAPGRSAVTGLLWTVGLVVFGVVAYGCVQYFWNYDYVMVKYGLVESLRDYSGFNRAGVTRAYSVTGSPLTLGFMGMISALGSIAILAAGSRRDPGALAAGSRRDPGALVATCLLLPALGAAAFSYTRSAWLGIVAGAVVAALLVMRGWRRVLLFIGPAVLLGLAARFVPDLVDNLRRHALTILSQDPTETSFHYVALLQAASFFWAHKLGVGLGSASFAGFTHGGGVQVWSENTFFLLGIQTGFQGLTAFVVFIGLALWSAYRLYRTPGADSFDRRLGAAVFLGFIGFSVGGMSLPTILDTAAFGPLWFLLAVAMNALEVRPATSAAGDA